jgi:hypothetical protein
MLWTTFLVFCICKQCGAAWPFFLPEHLPQMTFYFHNLGFAQIVITQLKLVTLFAPWSWSYLHSHICKTSVWNDQLFWVCWGVTWSESKGKLLQPNQEEKLASGLQSPDCLVNMRFRNPCVLCSWGGKATNHNWMECLAEGLMDRQQHAAEHTEQVQHNKPCATF